MARGFRHPTGMPRARLAARTAAVVVAALVGLFGAPGPFAPVGARAAGVIIVVNSTSDVTNPGPGLCSLRAAILAANNEPAPDGQCPTGTAGQDAIWFNIGTGVPVINVTADLPPITQSITICGSCHPGTTVRAKRVELRGPGAGTGLSVHIGDGSVIGTMDIDDFDEGIDIAASGVTITGSVLGPNNNYGIYAHAASVQIGGTSGITPGGPCTGDCNVISGNGSVGLYVSSSGTVQGNFIGTKRNGTIANANGIGVVVSSGTWTIGGDSTAARNVVSGNTGRGMDLHGCGPCAIQGNYIGTNSAGTGSLANGSDGISMDAFSATIGGTTSGAGNLISGNVGNGIKLSQASGVTIQGNWIGTTTGGAALGNGGDGIVLLPDGSGVDHTVIGSASVASAANTIAYNSGVGVRVVGNGSLTFSRYNSIRGNSIHDNGAAGIALESSANGGIAAPAITGIGPITGTACAGCAVDVYSDSADEGRHFEGTVNADGGGNWTYAPAVSGPNVTATNTDTNLNTSEFSAPVSTVTRRPDGRIRLGTGSFVGNNIYNTTGVNQTKTGSAAIGSTITFGISVQNDGSSADSFKVLASGTSTTMYGVRYFHGTTEITAAVVAGTYTTPSLAPGTTFLITAKVKVKSSATVGSSVTRLVTITSVGDSTKQDAVKFIGARA